MNVAHRAAGDVMCLKVPGKHIVVLSSQVAASDLLDKRSAIYSSRPDFILYKMYAPLSALSSWASAQALYSGQDGKSGSHSYHLMTDGTSNESLRKRCLVVNGLQLSKYRRCSFNKPTSS